MFMSTDTPTIQRIRQQLAEHPVCLYMKGTAEAPQCGYSHAVVQCLNKLGISFHTVNILEDPDLRQELKRFSQWPTYPQLYVKEELIGGCDIILEMAKNGELEALFSTS
jgi:monothiol glutaredoxin